MNPKKIIKRLKKLISEKKYNQNKFLLAFEYGLTISEVARKENIELSPKMIEAAEKMLLNEANSGDETRMAVQMIPNILSIFET